MCVRLCENFTYDEDAEDARVACVFCHDAKVKGNSLLQSTGKLDFLKWHLSSKLHLAGVNALRNLNLSLKLGILGMLLGDLSEKNKRQEMLQKNVQIRIKYKLS